MDSLALLVGVLLCLAVVNGRGFGDGYERQDPSLLSDAEDQGPKHHTAESRHRRRRWQMNYGYDYSPPYYPERRDYDRNQQDLLPRIVKLLEEISVYVKRAQSPPQPQPIYVPYPMPYAVPQVSYVPGCSCTPAKTPNVTVRFPQMDDTNQNWGFVKNDAENNGPIHDFARPISFDPIKPIRPMQRPAPSVEHGSQQPDNQYSTQAPKFEADIGSGRSPDSCNAGILACCVGDSTQQKNCFNNFGCAATYNDRTCSPESINEALEVFRVAYAPVP